MSSFIVEGNKRLRGTISISGNKNEVLPLIAASLLCDKPVQLNNVPDIGDMHGMLAIASQLGASISPFKNGSVTITAQNLTTSTLHLELSSKIRGSLLFASSLLVRTGKAVLPQPGGDAIGRRRIDTHFLVFQALGAHLEIARQKIDSCEECFTYILSAPHGLKGTEIFLDETSVTATENALIAASGACGVTKIYNAASEPHVQGLCRFLANAGVYIEGIGSNVLTVHGVKDFKNHEHTIGSDYIEAGSFICLAAATDSDLVISNVDVACMRMILFQFQRLGITANVDSEAKSIHIPDRQELVVRKDLNGMIPHIEDSPWPGFPSDLTSIILVAATQAKGTCLIHEKMFNERLFFVDKLVAMGAQIVLCDPHRAVVVGPSKLFASKMSSPDIRAGMALLIAALAAQGSSIINNIEQIDRGYEKIDTRLRLVGASIQRMKQNRRKNDLPA